jgi:hypothetical protein
MQTRVAGPNGLDPQRMTPDERLGEVADILARGILRLRARKLGTLTALSADQGDRRLDFPPDQRTVSHDSYSGEPYD